MDCTTIAHSGQHPPAIVPVRSLETWSELIAIEPWLLDAERLVRLLPEDRDYADWEQIKTQFSSHVGWGARRPALRSSRCFDIAYTYLLGIFEANWEVMR